MTKETDKKVLKEVPQDTPKETSKNNAFMRDARSSPISYLEAVDQGYGEDEARNLDRKHKILGNVVRFWDDETKRIEEAAVVSVDGRGDNQLVHVKYGDTVKGWLDLSTIPRPELFIECLELEAVSTDWCRKWMENGGLSGRKRARGGDSVSPRDSARGEQAASTKVVSQSGNKTEPQGSGRKPAIKLKPQASKVTYLHTLHRHCTAIRSAQPSGAHRPPCCTGLHAAQASMLPSGSTQRRHGHCWLRYALPRVASLAGR